MIIIGASGHGKVVLSTALAQQEKIDGFLDDNPLLQASSVQDYPVLGNVHLLESRRFGFATFGLGKNEIRKDLAAKYHSCIAWKTLIHPKAYVHHTAKIGMGTVVLAGAIIQPNATIGSHCIINTGATIDHDSIVSDFVHLGPGTHLAANVRIGQGSLLGIGSVVTQGIEIGEWVVVAAGSIVINAIASEEIRTNH